LEICFLENCKWEDTSWANKLLRNPTNVPVQYKIARLYKSSIYHKSNGKPKLKLRLSQDYDVYKLILKNETDLF